MRRILSLSVLALVLSGGAAFADRGGNVRDHRGGSVSSPGSRGSHGGNGGFIDRGAHGGRGGNGGFIDRGSRSGYNSGNYNRGGFNRGSYNTGHASRRPVYLNNGRFNFGGGVSIGWNVPATTRHYDYRYRPTAVLETPQPVAGYLWVPGQWRWTGYEWSWSAGYYQPDPAYQSGYQNSYPSEGYPPGY